jgi:CRISPR-associated protein Csh1
MIKEISRFVDELENSNPEAFSKNIELKEGLYIFLDMEKQNDAYVLKNRDNDGKILKDDIGLFTKETEMNPFFEKCLKLQINSIPVSPAKIFNPNKKIYNASCSPFALCFNKKNFIKYDSEILKNELKNQYFRTAEKFINKDKREHLEWFENFKGFMVNKFLSFINELEEFTVAKSNFNVNIFLKQPQVEDYFETHQLYLQKNVFNKDKFNMEIDDEVLGISDSLSGFNDKKRFLQHKTAPLEYNYRINGNVALKIWKFFRMQKNNQLPNPMPVFIDKQELNGKVVSIYNDDRKKGFVEIIKDLLDYHKEDLHNFYLIFFHNGLKGSRIIDLDFVPVFEYEFKNKMEIKALFNTISKEKGELLNDYSIDNVFAFQNIIVRKIFNNSLVQYSKKSEKYSYKYFDDIDPKFVHGDIIYNLILKYRKAFYDFIYKSKHQAITNVMFHNIMQNTIFDDIMHDEYKLDKKYHTNEISIKEKLNIWFSLYNFFNQNKKREDMINKTTELFERIKLISKNNNEQLNSDEEFAFAAGQVIWKLLIQSESANRTHALLEPFLQKTDAKLFKLAIARTFETYKHKFTLYPNKYEFDKIFSDVMGFEPDEKNMKNLLPLILAGYFKESIFKKEKEQDQNQKDNE